MKENNQEYKDFEKNIQYIWNERMEEFDKIRNKFVSNAESLINKGYRRE